MADWATISSLATAGGTLVLAVATYAAVRSSNRSARIAERAFAATLRPVLATARPEDPAQHVGFSDGRRVTVRGWEAAVEVEGDAIYLALAVRNLGPGLAVLDGWTIETDWERRLERRRDTDGFRRLTRDLYVPAGDAGFWQGALRDAADPQRRELAAAIVGRRPFAVDVLYGDDEGGQRAITRFGMIPKEGGAWIAQVALHWNLDRADPR